MLAVHAIGILGALSARMPTWVLDLGVFGLGIYQLCRSAAAARACRHVLRRAGGPARHAVRHRGPFYAIYLDLRGLDGRAFRATFALNFLIDGGVRLIAYAVLGLLNRETLLHILRRALAGRGLYAGGRIQTGLSQRDFVRSSASCCSAAASPSSSGTEASSPATSAGGAPWARDAVECRGRRPTGAPAGMTGLDATRRHGGHALMKILYTPVMIVPSLTDAQRAAILEAAGPGTVLVEAKEPRAPAGGDRRHRHPVRPGPARHLRPEPAPALLPLDRRGRGRGPLPRAGAERHPAREREGRRGHSPGRARLRAAPRPDARAAHRHPPARLRPARAHPPRAAGAVRIDDGHRGVRGDGPRGRAARRSPSGCA